jgi:murein DD-endopeptidase MepM/ murein hydrolase activator NlpD
VGFALVVSSSQVNGGSEFPRQPEQGSIHKKGPVQKTSCAPGVTLTLNASAANQGGLLLAELTSSTPLSAPQGTLDTETLAIWRADSPANKLNRWQGLVPIDLEKATGAYPLKLTAEEASGEKMSCEVAIHVTAGKFATESLKVAPQFVEPDPEQLERAKKEQQRLREIYATVTPERLWTGKFRIPLDGAVSGANFGRRRILNGKPSSPHTGVDFPAPTGTPVHAAQAGRVVLAEPLYFSGNTVLMDHGLGVYTLYGHLSEIGVNVGDSVAAGGLIGKVGATGRVTGPHLHWGLIVDRARVNALRIVQLPLAP